MNRFYRVVHAILRPLLYLFFPVSAVGVENIPAGGAVLCINHSSAWDPVLVALKIKELAEAGVDFTRVLCRCASWPRRSCLEIQ